MSRITKRVVAASAIAASLLLVLVIPALAKRSPFVGSWSGFNSSDGSTITLHIGGPRGDGTYNLLMLDDYSTACFNEYGESLRDWSRMEGVAEDNILTASGMLWCMTSPPESLREVNLSLHYEDADDTLELAPWGIIFHRVGG
jgi:hypothetical protein